MGEKAFPSDFGSKMDQKRIGGSRVDQVGDSSGGAGTPHPNGGEVRRMDLGNDPGQMPEDMKKGRVTHTNLDVGAGKDAGLGKMPRQNRTPRQTQPVRR